MKISGRIIKFLTLLFFAASCRQDDIRGTFVNDSSQEITIDCDHRIHSTSLSGKPMMPDNGASVTLVTTNMQQEQIFVSYRYENMISTFAKWDPYSDELIVGKDIYQRKSFENCSK